jgi:transposase
MFHLHEKLKYFLYPAAVDMRKSFYTLSGIVTSIMKRDVQSGEVFIFVNKRLTTMKILHLEHGGLVIYHKKLDSGVFKLGKTVQNVPLISAKMCHEPRPDFEKIATVMPLSVSVRTVPIISVRIVPFWRAA